MPLISALAGTIATALQWLRQNHRQIKKSTFCVSLFYVHTVIFCQAVSVEICIQLYQRKRSVQKTSHAKMYGMFVSIFIGVLNRA
jgi:hypothetical protein